MWHVGKACMPSPVLPDIGQWQGFRCCMWAELAEPIHLEVQKHICHVIVDPCNVLDVHMHVMLHSKEHEGTD